MIVVIDNETQMFNGKRYRRVGGARYFKHRNYLHRDVWESANGPIPPGHHVHHIDHDAANNALENLVCVGRTKHLREHMLNPERQSASSRAIKIAREAAKAWHATPEGIEWHRQHAKNVWEVMPLHPCKCSVCGNVYEAPFPGRSKYCHPNCKATALRRRRGIPKATPEWRRQNAAKSYDTRPVVEKQCEHCSLAFTTQLPQRAMFCGRRCAERARARAQGVRTASAAALNRLSREITCKQCAGVFLSSATRAVYCSADCKDTARRLRRKKAA